MANEIAMKLHTRPGDEVILDAEAHFITSEGGGPAFLSGVMLRGVPGAQDVAALLSKAAADVSPGTVHPAPAAKPASLLPGTGLPGGAVSLHG